MTDKREKILVLLADLIAITVSWVLFFYFRVESGLFGLILQPDFFLSLIAVYLYWLVIFAFVGMYRTWFAASRFDELSLLFKASFVGVFILFSLIYLDDYSHGINSSGRFLIFIYWGIFLLCVGVGRLLIRGFQRSLILKGIGRRNALIIGFTDKGHEIHEQIDHFRALGLDVVGYIAVKKENVGKSFKGIPCIGEVDCIEQTIDDYNVKDVIIATDKHKEEELISIMTHCENKNVGLKIVPDFFEILSGQAKTSQIYGFPLVDVMPQLMPEWEKKVKRIIDFLAAVVILILSSPVLLLTAIAIKLDSKGVVFFRQERCGLNGKSFKMIKFRSMRQDAEKNTGPVWSQKDDPRITTVGRFIRKVRIDEVPQMINVLRGEMSLVGPRPERPFFVEKLAKEIPYYRRRLRVRPGITGWAQVKHKYDETIEDVKVKLKFDLFYIENMSLRMDFKIMVRTVFVMLFGKGHYE